MTVRGYFLSELEFLTNNQKEKREKNREGNSKHLTLHKSTKKCDSNVRKRAIFRKALAFYHPPLRPIL